MGTKKGYDNWNMCRADDKVSPLATYRGKPLTKEVSRDIILRGSNRGDWIVTRGRSAAYDCFDCQYLYWTQNQDLSMNYVANYKIHRSDGGIRWNDCNYTATEWNQTEGRYFMHAADYG